MTVIFQPVIKKITVVILYLREDVEANTAAMYHKSPAKNYLVFVLHRLL